MSRRFLGQTQESSVSPFSKTGLARDLAARAAHPVQLPISMKPRESGKIGPGRIVFRPEETALWVVSARIPAKGSVYLYGVDGPTAGQWKTISLSEFSGYWAVDEDESVALRNLVPAIRPEGSQDKLDVLYSTMRIADAAVLMMDRIPFPPNLDTSDTRNMSDQFMATAYTCMMFVYEGIDAAGCAYDAQAIGTSALTYIRDIGRRVFEMCQKVGMAASEVDKDGAAALENASEIFFQESSNYLIWSLYLDRAFLLTQLSSYSEMIDYRAGAMTMEGEALIGLGLVRKNRDKILAKGIPEEKIKAVEDYWEASSKIGIELDPVLDTGVSSYLQRSGLNRGDLDSGRVALSLYLDQNRADIEAVRNSFRDVLPQELAGLGVEAEASRTEVDALVSTIAPPNPKRLTVAKLIEAAVGEGIKRRVTQRFPKWKESDLKGLIQASDKRLMELYALGMEDYNNFAKAVAWLSNKEVKELGARGLANVYRIREQARRTIQNYKDIKRRALEQIDFKYIEAYLKLLETERMSIGQGLFKTAHEFNLSFGRRLEAMRGSRNAVEYSKSLSDVLTTLATAPATVFHINLQEIKHAFTIGPIEVDRFGRKPEDIFIAEEGPIHVDVLRRAQNLNAIMMDIAWENRIDPAVTFYMVAEQATKSGVLFGYDASKARISDQDQYARARSVFNLLVRDAENRVRSAEEYITSKMPDAPPSQIAETVQWLRNICLYYYEGLPLYKAGEALPAPGNARRYKKWIDFNAYLEGEAKGEVSPFGNMPNLLKQFMGGAKGGPKTGFSLESYARSIYYAADLAATGSVEKAVMDVAMALQSPDIKPVVSFAERINILRDALRPEIESMFDESKAEDFENPRTHPKEVSGLEPPQGDMPWEAAAAGGRQMENLRAKLRAAGRPKVVYRSRLQNILDRLNGAPRTGPDAEERSAEDAAAISSDTIASKVARQEFGILAFFRKIRDVLAGKIFVPVKPEENQTRNRTGLAAFDDAASKTKYKQIMASVGSLAGLLLTIGIFYYFSRTPSSWAPRDPKPSDFLPPNPSAMSDLGSTLMMGAIIGIPAFLFLRMLKRKGVLGED